LLLKLHQLKHVELDITIGFCEVF